MRAPVNLRQSVNTATLDQDVKPVGEGEHRIHTGIERDGGLTNQYEATAALVANTTTIFTDSGKKLQVGPMVNLNTPTTRPVFPIYLDSEGVGAVPALSITARATIKNALDVCLSSDQKILVLKREGNTSTSFIYEERGLDGTLLNSRVVNTWLDFLGGGYYRAATIVRSRTLLYVNPVEIVFVAAGTSGGLAYYLENGSPPAIPPSNFTVTGMSCPSAPYVYKYENANSYLVSSPGDSLAYVGNITAGGIFAPFVAKYFVLQRSGGFSRHIVTKQPALNAGLIECIGLIGHTTFLAAFSAVPLWQTPGGMVATAVDSTVYRVGYGYVEAYYTQGGATRAMSAPSVNVFTYVSYFTDRAAGSIAGVPNVAIDYFGQLTNNFGVGNGSGPGFRINSINGVQSFISLCMTDPTGAGKMISTLGEFDALYTPAWYADGPATPTTENNTIVWKYGDEFYAITIGIPTVLDVERIGRDIYRINTLGLVSILDCEKKLMYEDAVDYHGQATYAGASGTTTRSIAFKREGQFCDSIDVGERIIPTGATVTPVACDYKRDGDTFEQRTIAIADYRDGNYLRSWGSPLAPTFIDNALVNTVYVESIRIPIPLGATFDDRGAVLRSDSFYRDLMRADYKIGNKIPLAYDFFELFSNLYAYAEGTIYLVPVSASGFVQSLQPIAVGQALKLIATAPTAVYFLSEWDNSLYSFDGGRALVKGSRFSQSPAIIKGVYNVAENGLTLDTSSRIYFVRDGIVSYITKNADQATIALYSADDGAYIVGAANWYKYGYNAVGTAYPFAWKSAYYGLDADKQAYLSAVIYTVYSPTKAELELRPTIDVFDESGSYSLDPEPIHIYPVDYSDAGYVRIRRQPAIQRGLGVSVGLECSAKIVLADVAVEIAETASEPVAASRSV